MKGIRNRKTSTAVAAFLVLWNVGLFSYVWITYYNDYCFHTHAVLGCIASIMAYLILYLWLCHTYRAFKLASTRITSIAVSQLISIGLADLILWGESCLMYRDYVSFVPGLKIAVLQIIGTGISITLIKRLVLLKVCKPKETLVVYGKNTTFEEAKYFALKLDEYYYHMYHVAGYLSENEITSERRRGLGEPGMIPREVLDGYGAVILFEVSVNNRRRIFHEAIKTGMEILLTPNVDDIFLQGFEEKPYLDTPIMKYGYNEQNQIYLVFKRALDIIMSALLIVLLSPLMLITALLIKLEDGGPVLFKQERYTKDWKKFNIIKFRSMIVDADKAGVVPTVDHDPRITRVGRVIRATRIDELPQLFNILKGDMSFVGPRPERVEHVDKYSKEVPEFGYRLMVRAGLTGYAQVYGKYNTSAYDKLRLDLIYIEHQSIVLDFQLLLLTARVIFTPESTEGFTKEKSEEMRQVCKEPVTETIQKHRSDEEPVPDEHIREVLPK